MTAQNHKEQFFHAIAALHEAHAGFRAGTLKPVQHGQARSAAIAAAMAALALAHNVVLQTPLQINTLGEFSIVAIDPNQPNPKYGCGRFGAVFADRLTRHKARTGVYGPAILDECNGWCMLNHFAAEALVVEYAQELASAQAASAG